MVVELAHLSLLIQKPGRRTVHYVTISESPALKRKPLTLLQRARLEMKKTTLFVTQSARMDLKVMGQFVGRPVLRALRNAVLCA